MSELKLLQSHYKKFKPAIQTRLREFKQIWQKTDKFLFQEICFCTCAVQTKSRLSSQAIQLLVKENLLYEGSTDEISKVLRPIIRFHNNKAKWIVQNREFLKPNGKFQIKDKIDSNNIPKTRVWLQKNILGFGFKEASHFLRNIGFGKDLAILDVHVLKGMEKFGIIKDRPDSLTPKKYLHFEKKLTRFSHEISIPLDELDFVFWSMETGEVLK